MKYLNALLNKPLARNGSDRLTDKTDKSPSAKVLSVSSVSCPWGSRDEDWDLLQALGVLHRALSRAETMYVECTDPTLRGHTQVLLSAVGRDVEFRHENLILLHRVCADFEAHLAALLELRAGPRGGWARPVGVGTRTRC
jgi:hypothetical protein